MESSDESEVEEQQLDDPAFKFYFWNNWVPPKRIRPGSSTKSDKEPNATDPVVKSTVRRIGTWLPPDHFGLDRLNNQKPLLEKPALHKPLDCSIVPEERGAEGFKWNEDWGERCRNLSDIEGDEIVWDLIHPGLFGILKLTINSQENIVAYANAEYTTFDGSEKVMIVINNQEYLRKLLGVVNHEWIALTDAVQTHQENVSYDAMSSCDWRRLKPLQQMWYILCKRRHWLPSVCVRLKRAGVQKMTQYLQILPKFVVVDIRTCIGKPIS